MKIAVHWFRRDLRVEDNKALNAALESGLKVLPIFIFDKKILEDLPSQDPRVTFIHERLNTINETLKKYRCSVLCFHGTPMEVWKNLVRDFEIEEVFTNRDYEPYALERDQEVCDFLTENGIPFHTHKDQVIFEKNEILKDDGDPYVVFTPYKRKWLHQFRQKDFSPDEKLPSTNFYQDEFELPSLESLGFKPSDIKVKSYTLDHLDDYEESRNFPARDQTSYLSPHLRFGTISIRQIIAQLKSGHEVFLSELAWREFFMQILFHFPQVVNRNFYSKYDGVQWRNNEEDFEKWKHGKTGYPMVDAGMRELNRTGYMHNRVRMVVASFLCKHLLIDWKWGEAYFAEKLLDYELSSNNGNWQWAAGTGCDAAPYFRIFNPSEQIKKFDKNLDYIKKWVPEINSFEYPQPMVDHKGARERALKVYKEGIEN